MLIPTNMLVRKREELEDVRQDIVSGRYSGESLEELKDHENQLEQSILALDELLTDWR